MPVGVEETAGEGVGDFQGGRFTEEGDFRIGRDALGAGEDLKGDEVFAGADNLRETAAYDGKLVIGNALGPERYGRFGDGLKLGIYSLVCFICHFGQGFG